MGADGLFKPIEQALWQVIENLQDFAVNYIFGILALLFGIRCVMGLLEGRFSVLLCILTVIMGFFAVTMGQTFWTDLPIYHTLFGGGEGISVPYP